MASFAFNDAFVPDGNPLPGSDPGPDTAPPVGDPVPSNPDPTEPSGTPRD